MSVIFMCKLKVAEKFIISHSLLFSLPCWTTLRLWNAELRCFAA